MAVITPGEEIPVIHTPAGTEVEDDGKPGFFARWFYSTNHKDIGTLYLLFSIFSGIINETWFEVREEGTYYGQCSEICGIKHAYMPIHIEVVSKPEFAQWVANGGTFLDAVATNDSAAASADALPK